MRGTSDAVALAAVGAIVAVACMPPPSGGANTPGSCNSAAISASVDAYRGQGMSAQTAAWQARCDRDQQIAAFNEAQALEAQRMQLDVERQRLENERLEQARQARLAELESRAQMQQATPTPPPAIGQPARLLVFGGKKHDVFLGCLCGETESDSVLNKYGEFGSPYRSESIWNHYGDYGSRYRDTSVCYRFASSPPVVVTDGGDFIGYLTIDKSKPGAITDARVVEWLETVVCAN